MGGFGVAFLTSAVLSYRKEHVSFSKLILGYIVIALLWETYEHVHNIIATGVWNGLREPLEDILDTTKDMINGFIGISVAYLFIRK